MTRYGWTGLVASRCAASGSSSSSPPPSPSALSSSTARRRTAIHIRSRCFSSTEYSGFAATAGANYITKRPTSTTTTRNEKIGTLKVWGRDRNGIVARCTQILGEYGCNITKSEHWTDIRNRMFFQRLEFRYQELGLFDESTKQLCRLQINEGLRDLEEQQPESNQPELQQQNDRNSSPTILQSSLNWRDRRKKIGILVSKMDHCLWELLLRHSAHELDADVHTVVSNHDTLHAVADAFGIPYHHTPLHSDMSSSERKIVEQQQLELLKDVDVVVLARYMQVLSPQFLEHFPPDGIINIHHSFLPAFMGSRPYHNAYERGVKLIGATAHYVTSDLDEGPILEQDVIAVSHRDSVKQLIQKGRILERNVLFRALDAHLSDRTIIHGNRTIVFGD
mmetsp:Transcript_23364/g.55393  ORF Transcript_23364/g.55393 Transcript_23364/m.55393 type:complete len:393 (+) Transcript_23364:3-1181(+)